MKTKNQKFKSSLTDDELYLMLSDVYDNHKHCEQAVKQAKKAQYFFLEQLERMEEEPLEFNINLNY